MARLIMLIFFIAAVYAVLRLLSNLNAGLNRPDRAEFEATVRCQRCGAYVAKRHAIPEDNGYICSSHTDRPVN